MSKRIILAGGSGFIGNALAKELLVRNYEVVVLTRTPRSRNDGVKEIGWDGAHIGEWIKFLEGAGAVVNLVGRSVHCIHTPKNFREIIESRVNSVCTIAAAFRQIQNPPRVWVQASGIGFYGDCGERLCDESTSGGSDNLSEICQQWESAFNSVEMPKTRRVILRIGVVLGNGGGGLPVMARLTKWFLGGTAGSGRQYFSWIHLADLTRMFVESIERENMSGIFNAVAPNPKKNAEFMRELRRTLHRPWSPPAPEWAVRIGARFMKTEPSFALTSCRCEPKRFIESGFKFQFPELRHALKNLYE
ncbi:MAG TPA: TIGR01777 family oxidoreductase [Dongiaceae bacterium]|nr:TIGR01777 family oxidoreductase [Dongiaceae bacterium]